MRIWCILLLAALQVLAQAPTVLSTDLINLRNFALSPDGGEVVYAAALDGLALQRIIDVTRFSVSAA